MFGKSKILAGVLAVVATAWIAQPSFADHPRQIGVGANVSRGKPAYSMPAYTGGNYVVRNRPNQSPYVYGGFVPPSVVYQPSFVMPNYYLPGDYYARSTYYVPAYASPVVVYPAPLTGGGFIFSPAYGGGPNRHNLTFGPLNR